MSRRSGCLEVCATWRPREVPPLFQFPNDMLPVDAEPNRLNDQVLVRYYERDWREIAH